MSSMDRPADPGFDGVRDGLGTDSIFAGLGPLDARRTPSLVPARRTGIEVPIIQFRLDKDGPARWMIRVSCQLYNDESDLEALRSALEAMFSS